LVYCPYCGLLNTQGSTHCANCHQPMTLPPPLPQRPGDLGQDAGIRMLIPVGRSGWAIAAGYFGLFSLLCFPAPLALVFGILAIRDIQTHPNRHGMGRAIFGIVMEILGSVLLVFGLIGAIGGRH
jgi:uncharacterized RDD family membrane protein YckC